LENSFFFFFWSFHWLAAASDLHVAAGDDGYLAGQQ
jgi:hypothetical protein